MCGTIVTEYYRLKPRSRIMMRSIWQGLMLKKLVDAYQGAYIRLCCLKTCTTGSLHAQSFNLLVSRYVCQEAPSDQIKILSDFSTGIVIRLDGMTQHHYSMKACHMLDLCFQKYGVVRKEPQNAAAG